MTDIDKADQIAKYLQLHNTTTPNSTALHNNVTEQAQQIRNYYQIPANKLTKIPNHKTPGPDNILNVVLKHLPTKGLAQLTYIINTIIKLQYFPNSWKTAIVVPILKPKKPPHLPSSYRPISLLNCISKIAEKHIHTVLKSYINKKTLIPNIQFGFRSGHSTTLSLCAKLFRTP